MPTRSQPTGDPLLKGAAWRRIRAYWIRKQDPCHACGRQINYTHGATGPDALDVGHWPVSRHEGRALGWTDEQINALPNTRPECRQCSREGGMVIGLRARAGQPTPQPRPIESDEW